MAFNFFIFFNSLIIPLHPLLPPILLSVILLIVLFCLLLRHPRLALVALVCALLFNWHWQCVALRFRSLEPHTHENCIRVMTYNVGCPTSHFLGDDEALVRKVTEANPDVLFLTEFMIATSPRADSLLTSLYPYRQNLENTSTGSMFYSRLPIVSYHVPQGIDYHYDFVFCCRLLHEADTLSVYTAHLRSNNSNNHRPDSIRSLDALRAYLDNYLQCASLRDSIAHLICADFGDDPRIFMGDMNDVACSPALTTLSEAGMRNAWWRGGFGYGATIHDPLPYRIDHILYSSEFWLHGISIISGGDMTDHDALVADFELY